MIQRGAIILTFMAMASGAAMAQPAPDGENRNCQATVFQNGIASIYSARLQGQLTKSEEPMDHGALTAAHRTLPLGSYVQVTDEQTGRSVVVRINDRGPFVPGRILDVTHAVRSHFDWNPRQGLHRVTLRVCS